jgi:capsule polysaccharide modification protein KpsS
MVMYASLFHVSITFAGLTQVKYQIQLQLLLASYPVCLHHQSPADGHKMDGRNQVSIVKKLSFRYESAASVQMS